MIEYPHIISSAKAPRKYGVAFDKLDGSNFRAKFTRKQGFNIFGTRHELINEDHPTWGNMVTVFKRDLLESLEDKFKKDKNFRDEREITVYGEYLGANSFAGQHVDEPKEIILFDVLIGHKNRKFLEPMNFIKEFQEIVKIPDVIYVGNLNNQFIQEVRENKDLKEGVIFKGTEPSGAYRGGIWTCKIKTQLYFEKLKAFWGVDWVRYWE